MNRTIAAAIALTALATPAAASWCDPTLETCWTAASEPPAVRKRPSQVRGWIKHREPARVIVRREVVTRPLPVALHQHDADGPGSCKVPLDSLGNDVRGEDDARLAARKAWMELARWRYGERYMELANARDTYFQCNRVQAPLTEGKIGDKGDKFSHLSRCELRATPCAAPIVREDK